MKLFILIVCTIGATSADVSHLTNKNGYTYSKPIPSVSYSVPELSSAPTIAPTPGSLPPAISFSKSLEQPHGLIVGNTGSVGQLPHNFGPIEQSLGNFGSGGQSYEPAVLHGQSLGPAIQSYGQVGSVGQSLGQLHGTVGQLLGNGGSVAHSQETVGLHGQSLGPAIQSYGQVGSVGQSFGHFDGSVGQSLGKGGLASHSLGPVGPVSNSFGSTVQSYSPVSQTFGSIGQSLGSTDLLGSVQTHSYIPPATFNTGSYPSSTHALPGTGSISSSAYLPPQPQYLAQGPLQSYSGPASVSPYAVTAHANPLTSLGHQEQPHSLESLGYSGSTSLSGYHAQNIVNNAKDHRSVQVGQVQVPTYPVITGISQHPDTLISGSVAPCNEYLPPGNGLLDVRSVGGTQDLISGKVTAPFGKSLVLGEPHSTSQFSASGEANLLSSPLGFPQVVAPITAGHGEYTQSASKTGGYHYNAPI